MGNMLRVIQRRVPSVLYLKICGMPRARRNHSHKGNRPVRRYISINGKAISSSKIIITTLVKGNPNNISNISQMNGLQPA
jgi:hypothetical protein